MLHQFPTFPRFGGVERGPSPSGVAVGLSTPAVFNVKSFGAIGDNVTDDLPAFNRAVALATATAVAGNTLGTGVYFPAGAYRMNGTMNMSAALGVSLYGEGAQSVRINGVAAGVPVIEWAPATELGFFSVVRGIRFNGNQVASHVIRLTNADFISFYDCAALGSNLGDAVRIDGAVAWIYFIQCLLGANNVGFDARGVHTLISGGGVYPQAITIQGGELLGGTYALDIEGCLATSVINTVMFCNGASMLAVAKIDGANTQAAFYNCHTENNYNTADTGSDFLIGSVAKPWAVALYNGSHFGQGNAVNFQLYSIRVHRCRSLIVEGNTFTKLAQASGYNGGAIRLETTWPDAGDTYRLQTNDKDTVTGPLYSDVGAIIPTTYLGGLDSERQQASSIADSTTITNTVTETAFSKTFLIRKNTLQPGRIIRINARGTLATAAAAGTIRVRVRIGGAAGLVMHHFVTMPNAQPAAPWNIQASAVVRTIGAAGIIMPGVGTFGCSTFASPFAQIGNVNLVSFTANTTANLTGDITIEFGTADAANQILMQALEMTVEPSESYS